MGKNVFIFVLLICCFSSNINGDAGSDITKFFNNIKDSLTSAWNSLVGGETMTSIGETFGIIPADYVYSYAIWNNSHIPIYSSQQSMTSFMGGSFPNAEGISVVETISSWLNPSAAIIVNSNDSSSVVSSTSSSGTDSSVWKNAPATLTVMNQHLYFNLYIAQTSDVMTNPLYLDQIATLGDKNSTKVYHYHAYTSREWSSGSQVHVPKIELLGYTQPASSSASSDSSSAKTTETVTISNKLNSMVFFNNTSEDVQLSFVYDSNPLKIGLEKNSFNTIALSDTSKSLRPNTFSFSNFDSSTVYASVDFPDVGFDGKTYTMELYQDKGMVTPAVGIQSLLTGNYDLPISDRVRDISPIICNLWWQSVSQSGVSDDQMSSLLDLPGQLWVVYDSVDTPIMSKIGRAGGAISWTIIRPEISKKSAYLYFLYIQTASDDAAQKFIAEFLYGTMGDGIKKMYLDNADQDVDANASQIIASLSSAKDDSSTDSLTNDQKIATITGSLNYTLGSMVDAVGTVGYLVGADYFASVGIGSATQNYMFTPSIYNMSSLVSVFGMYVNKTDSLQSSLAQWILNYVEDASFVEEQVKNLIIISNKSAYVNSGALTDAGNAALQALLTGPISIQNPSVYMSVVQNQYATTMKSSLPDGMPTPDIVASTPMPKYEVAAQVQK